MTERPAPPDGAPSPPAHLAGEVTVHQPIRIVGIAEGGMQVEAPFPLQNDSVHEFRLALGNRAVVLKGRVTRCQIGELRDGVVLYRCGVEFVDPAPHALDAIRDFIAQ
jgi:hypothetical protein